MINNLKKIGLVINPMAGIGGKAGLKGSDGEEIQAKALACGVKPEAVDKATRALRVLEQMKAKIEIVTFEGVMGGAVAERLGFSVRVLGEARNAEKTNSDDKIGRAHV